MTATEIAAAINRIAQADDVDRLTGVMVDLRRDFPGDGDAEVLVRTADLKRRRIVQET